VARSDGRGGAPPELHTNADYERYLAENPV
jgi:hypothetical protein